MSHFLLMPSGLMSIPPNECRWIARPWVGEGRFDLLQLSRSMRLEQ
jgi:hypothetical protein